MHAPCHYVAHGGQWFKGKNSDTHCPLGPWIVTPDGSTIRFARKPPEFLQVGDVMEAAIEKIGVLRNAVAAHTPSESAQQAQPVVTGR